MVKIIIIQVFGKLNKLMQCKKFGKLILKQINPYMYNLIYHLARF